MDHSTRARTPRRWALGLVAVGLLAGDLAAPAHGLPPAHDLPGWHLELAQDFDVDAPLGRFADTYPGWAGYDGGRDTSRDLDRRQDAQGRYDSSTTTTVHDGLADVRVHTEGPTPQVMALTPTTDGRWWQGRRYGRYSVRFRTDDVPGYKLAWLLWPTSDDWTDGEVDFPEADLGGSITAHAHDVTGTPSRNAYSLDTGTATDRWNIATIQWEPGRLTFTLNDRSWTTVDPTAVPTGPMRWVLQTETQLDSAAPDAAAAGHVQIDWVAVWSRG